MAARIAPGKHRSFRFMQWPGHDPSEWQRVHAKAVAQESPDSVPQIHGYDRSAAAIRAATENAERARVTNLVRFEKQDALRVDNEAATGFVVTNPPYGVRLGDAGESRRLMAGFGLALRERFSGWHVALMAPAQLERTMRIPLETKLKTTNGGLRVHFLAGLVATGQGQTGV